MLMTILLRPLSLDDFDALYQFETINRSYFTQSIPDRGDDYFDLQTFEERNLACIDEHIHGTSKYLLIKQKDGSIMGRLNLTDINPYEKTASIGYRIGEAFTSQGLAKTALAHFFNLDLQPIETVFAKTTATNLASIRVLEANGFKKYAIDDDYFIMNGEAHQFVYFKRSLPN